MSKRFFYFFIILQLLYSCKNEKKQLEIYDEEFSIKKHLSEQVHYVKFYDKDGLLTKENWLYKNNSIPFLTLDQKTHITEYKKELFDESLLDTPKIYQAKIDDSTYEITIVAKNYPVRLMNLIGWMNIGDVYLEKETKFNAYKLTLNSNTIRKDSIPFLFFKFYDPITDRLIKSIEKVNLNLTRTEKQ